MNNITLCKSRLWYFLIFTIIVANSSCARKISFGTSAVVPAAQGKVKVKRDNNKNYELVISITNLAEASRLSPARELYVVWMESEEGTTKNLGRLNTSTRFLSKKLRASLTAVTPLKPIRVYITAESDARIQYPGQQIVLATERF